MFNGFFLKKQAYINTFSQALAFTIIILVGYVYFITSGLKLNTTLGGYFKKESNSYFPSGKWFQFLRGNVILIIFLYLELYTGIL